MINRGAILVSIILWVFSSFIYSAELRIIDAKRGADDGDRFGDACEGLGDINGDGLGDFLVTEFSNRKLHLYLGGPQPFNSPPAITWEDHASDNGLFSFSPVNVGDVDCDGTNDFITIFGEDEVVRLFLGMETLDSTDNMNLFHDTTENWDFIVWGGGDNNNDGNSDFWLFSKHAYYNDTIMGYCGCSILDTIQDMKILRNYQPDNKYFSMTPQPCASCDLNGDSIPDVIFGESTDYLGYPGRIKIIWGGDSIPLTPDLTFYAPDREGVYYYFGADIACLGDVSGDGIDDIWINQRERNYIYFGGQPFDTFPDVIIDWSLAELSICNVGDINNDGYNDVAIIDEDYLSSHLAFIYCYPGMDGEIDAIFSDEDFYQYILQGPMSNIGIDISAAGDVDGDGIDDVLISARETNNDQWDNGWIIILAGWEEPVSVDEDEHSDQAELFLAQNYPNPFNASTDIQLRLPRAGIARVIIYNLLGEIVSMPLNGYLNAGKHHVIWDGTNENGNPASSGIYLYKLEFAGIVMVNKMILVK
jgi:hypothetical protein